MSEKREAKLKEGQANRSSSFSVKIDIATLNKMSSGSCFISSTIPTASQESEKIAVCKEGQTIKIFKIVEEKKQSDV